MNWNRVGELLKMYSEGKPIPFKSVTVKLLEDIKMFLLRAPLGGNKKGTVSRNTASTYFAIVKAGVKQAFIDEYLTVDVSAKVKGIPSEDKLRASLTLDEVKRLADTPCESDVLRRASFFSILTGLRHIDIKNLKWKQISQTSNGSWRIDISQIKTKVGAYLPISDQAYAMCGTRSEDEELLVFAGLQNAAWISKPLKKWIEAAGINDNVVELVHLHDFDQLIHQVGFQCAADATVLQRDQTVVTLTDHTALLNKGSVNVDLTYIIDNNRKTDSFLVFENTVHQRSLATAEISCQKQDRHFLVFHLRVIF